MTLATICNGVAIRVGVKPTSSWINNPDLTALEILTWVREAQDRIGSEQDWQQLIREFRAEVSLSTENALNLPEVARFVPGSMWVGAGSTDPGGDWTPRCQVYGPLVPAEWEAAKRGVKTLTQPIFSMIRGSLRLLGVNVGDVVVGLGYPPPPFLPLADTDVMPLGAGFERAIELCATWLYRDAKGLPTQSAQGQYLDALAKLRAWDQPIYAMQMGRRCHVRRHPAMRVLV